MENVIGKEVMTLPLLNEWLAKVMPYSPVGTPYPRSREGGMPPGLPPRPGLKWKPETHRWIRPEEQEVRTERAQPKFQEISKFTIIPIYIRLKS